MELHISVWRLYKDGMHLTAQIGVETVAEGLKKIYLLAEADLLDPNIEANSFDLLVKVSDNWEVWHSTDWNDASEVTSELESHLVGDEITAVFMSPEKIEALAKQHNISLVTDEPQ